MIAGCRLLRTIWISFLKLKPQKHDAGIKTAVFTRQGLIPTSRLLLDMEQRIIQEGFSQICRGAISYIYYPELKYSSHVGITDFLFLSFCSVVKVGCPQGSRDSIRVAQMQGALWHMAMAACRHACLPVGRSSSRFWLATLWRRAQGPSSLRFNWGGRWVVFTYSCSYSQFVTLGKMGRFA